MIATSFRQEDRAFVLKPSSWPMEGPAIQRLPGAEYKPTLGAFLVPEIAVTEVAGLVGGMPECYLDFLRQGAEPPPVYLIPAVTPGGRILRAYQRHDAARLYDAHGASYSVPGTGKTTIFGAAFSAMHAAGLAKHLVWIMPLQTLGQIRDECRDVFHMLSSPVDKWKGEPVICVNYEKIYRDKWSVLIESVLRDSVLLLDETQRAGNKNLASDQIMLWRWQAKYRWAGSGTPIQNRIPSFYRPHVFVTGSSVSEDAWNKLFVRASDGEANPRTLPRLAAITKTYASRRTKEDPEVALGLPPLSFVHRLVKLEGRQLALYKQCATQRIAEIQGADERTWSLWLKNPFERMLREFQVLRDPRLLGEDLPDDKIAKVRGLDDLLDELHGQKVVVWSGHPSILDRVVAKHGGVAYHGAEKPARRDKNRLQFMQDPACRLFCANYSVAGTGLDGLQKVSSYAIVLDLPNQAPDWQQLVDRLHRSGQQNPVTIYLLLAQDTIETWQWDRIQRKGKWAGVALGDKAQAPKVAAITRAELMRALKGV